MEVHARTMGVPCTDHGRAFSPRESHDQQSDEFRSRSQPSRSQATRHAAAINFWASFYIRVSIQMG